MNLSPAELEALWLSLKVAALAVLGSLPFALAVALWLAHTRATRLKLAVELLVHLPLVLPPVLTGWLLLVAFGREGWIGAWLEQVLGIRLVFRWTGAALAAAVMAFPLFVRAIRISIEAIPREVTEMAATLGASRWSSFWRVILPLALPGIVAGATLAFAKALGEFGATISFVANVPGETQTLALAIWTQTQVPGGEAAIGRLAVVSLLLAIGALVLSEWLVRRHRRRLEVTHAPRW